MWRKWKGWIFEWWDLFVWWIWRECFIVWVVVWVWESLRFRLLLLLWRGRVLLFGRILFWVVVVWEEGCFEVEVERVGFFWVMVWEGEGFMLLLGLVIFWGGGGWWGGCCCFGWEEVERYCFSSSEVICVGVSLGVLFFGGFCGGGEGVDMVDLLGWVLVIF